ncbi:MAG: penicillin acylase family protein [Bacteroidota bacterium]
MRKLVFLLLLSTPLMAQKFMGEEIARWKNQAKQITIIRDTWGIPHVYGKTDADAVFGLLYAQCEDDFERVEMNYINAEGRLAEVEGESKLFNDLRTQLFQDTLRAIAIYKDSPPDLKKLMDAFADGVNYFIYAHPTVKPKLLNRFQPWMPLLFSEGSIGSDIESISLTDLKNMYGNGTDISHHNDLKIDGSSSLKPDLRGSNGFAIAPYRSATGNAILLINPHTSFYFRPEVHVTSEDGLNAYGAVTWGQFFIYQGFNSHCGWMHPSSGADAIDEYSETIVKRNDSLFYKYGSTLRSLPPEKITLAYKKGNKISSREFTVYHTHHGPVITKQGEQWISVRLMQEPLQALTQSFIRTKSTGFEDFKKVMDLRTNSSNNTVYADDKGNIAYWHGNFIPRRNPSFDWTSPVDGSNPETEWKGLHTMEETIHLYNPAIGWIQNCNSTPFTAAGSSSPDKTKYPAYMAPDPENPRGINAVRVLTREPAFTLEKLIAAAYDPYLVSFEELIPSLISAYESAAMTDEELKTKLNEPINLLRQWDKGYSETSIPTTLAIVWGNELKKILNQIPERSELDIIELMIKTSASDKIKVFSSVIDQLQLDFGTWKVAWGEINRFQRLTGNITETFDDGKMSIPVASASSFWGSLASFESSKYPGTKKMYGNTGNSFVAVVEFGKKVRAKSLLAGGENSKPSSPHFNDQALIYSKGQFKDVWFYKEDVTKHAERTYHLERLNNFSPLNGKPWDE